MSDAAVINGHHISEQNIGAGSYMLPSNLASIVWFL